LHHLLSSCFCNFLLMDSFNRCGQGEIFTIFSLHDQEISPPSAAQSDALPTRIGCSLLGRGPAPVRSGVHKRCERRITGVMFAGTKNPARVTRPGAFPENVCF
jgi:hypothetical protein